MHAHLWISLFSDANNYQKSFPLFFFILYFFSDRFRTIVNVMGDAYGSGIVEHLSSKDIMMMDHVAKEEGNTIALNDRYSSKDPEGFPDAEAI